MTAKACLKECMFLVSIQICPINVHIWLVCVGSSGSCCSVALWNLHKVFHFSVCSPSLSLSLSLSLVPVLVSNHLNFHTCAVFLSFLIFYWARERERERERERKGERSVSGVDVGCRDIPELALDSVKQCTHFCFCCRLQRFRVCVACTDILPSCDMLCTQENSTFRTADCKASNVEPQRECTMGPARWLCLAAFYAWTTMVLNHFLSTRCASKH